MRRGSLAPAATGKIERVTLDRESCGLFDAAQQFGGEGDIQILDPAALEAGEVTVGIGAIAVEPTAGPIEAFDHPGTLQGLEVLIHRGVADVAAAGVQLLEDVAGTEVILHIPEQLKHHPPLPRQPHAQIAAAGDGALQSALERRVGWLSGGCRRQDRRVWLIPL